LSGRSVPITWQERRAQAWLPGPLDERAIDLSSSTIRKTEQAAASVRRADDLLPGSWEAVARILLRSEGVASSDIEGLRAPIEAVVAAEVDDTTADRTAAWVADNLAVVHEAVLSSGRPLSVAALHRWHRRLMQHGDLPASFVGRFRTAQGWIGGTSPIDAVFVPPPPDAVGPLVRDLITFANRLDVDPVTQAAMVHAQFETIHPYGDGNGRLGRVLIGWLLARRLDVVLPPPVSVLIARDPGGYLSGLYQFRDGSLDAYVGWFADIVGRAGDASVVLGTELRTLLTDWHDRIDDLRADAAAHRLVDLLPKHPVLTSSVAAAELGVSDRAARTALDALAARSIVAKLDLRTAAIGRPQQWWIATDLVDAVGRWSG
jgi:Fic family protein